MNSDLSTNILKALLLLCQKVDLVNENLKLILQNTESQQGLKQEENN